MNMQLLAVIAALVCAGRGGAESRPGNTREADSGEAASAVDAPATPDGVTFSEHVAPIVFRSCLPCHRSGESAPFQLLAYGEVAKRARQIVEVTRSRYMPPWLPSPEHGAFAGSRRLSDEDVATFARWVDAGAPEGDPARLPPVPPAVEGWQLGMPDLIVTMPAPFVVPEEGLDVFRNFVLPIPVERARFVEAVELRASNKRVVHHAVMKVDRTASSRELDAKDPEPGFPGMEMALSESPGGQYLGWTPGKVPLRSPDGMAWTLVPGSDMVVQLHMVTTGKPEPVQVSIGFYFTEHPPTQRPLVIRLRNDEIDIPAGESAYVVEDSLTLTAGVSVSLIYPHAHHLARRIEAFGELPDGSRRELILIEDWDFSWQDEYRYETPVLLPKGTRLTMRYTFDNSAENPRNPTVPPGRVRFGNRSLDEMATLTLQVLTESVEARSSLVEASCRHRVEQYPGYWTSRLNLGAILAEQGKFEEAVVHLRAGVELEPQSVDLQLNLGAVLVRMEELPEAMACFQEALRLSPGNPEVHANLAILEGAMGRWDKVAEHYRAVLESNPQDMTSLRGLGSALIRLEKLDDAAATLGKAVALDPSDHLSRYQLGKVESLRGRLEEATQAFLAGLRLHPLPEAHRDLARVYTARGMNAEAAEQLEEARRLAARKRR
jgi:tetratricopeptide (TPR) repeat protein